MKNRIIYIDELSLIRPENIFKAILCCSGRIDYEGLIPHLHPQERDYFETLKFEKRIKRYLMGRYVAKQAVSALTGEKDLSNILIQSGIFTQPIVVSNQQNIQVSITHSDNFAAALAFPEVHPMGIDLEKINLNQNEVLESQMTEAEKERIRFLSFSYSYETLLTLLWTAKEALSKALKTGLMTPFQVFEISKIEFRDDYIMSYYINFAQYKVISFIISNYVCSIVHPLKSYLHLDIKSIKEVL